MFYYFRYQVTAGVPQGSILGPLLFLLYINDITMSLESEMHLYADDAVLMTNLQHDPNNMNIIEQDLQRLHQWADKWHMSFNASKTKYMIVSRTKTTIYQTPRLNNIELENVQSYPQLGLTLDDSMNWEAHITKLISKANRKIGLIWKISEHLPRICAENMYNYYIRPVLDYGSTIYDNCGKQLREKLEDTQRRAGIACTRAFCRTPTKVLLSELGWSTLETRRSYLRLLQTYRMKNHHVPNYLRTILPPPQGHYSNYPTRFHNNVMVPHTKTAKCHEAFITKTTLEWNSLDEETKDCTSINTFKKLQKKNLFPTKTQYLSKGKGKHSHADETGPEPSKAAVEQFWHYRHTIL